MKKTYRILGCKDGVASNGNAYTTFRTNEGTTTTFNQKLIAQLKQVQHDEVVDVEVKEDIKGDKTFFNIVKLLKLRPESSLSVEEIAMMKPKEKAFKPMSELKNEFTGKPKLPTATASGTDKNCELMTTKDIFSEIFDKSLKDKPKEITIAMERAIELVKQARKAFE